jgi:hypothetical protein
MFDKMFLMDFKLKINKLKIWKIKQFLRSQKQYR